MDIINIIDVIIEKLKLDNNVENANANDNLVHIFNKEKTIDFTIDVLKYNKIKQEFITVNTIYESNIILNIEQDGLNINTYLNQLINFTEKFIQYKVPFKAQLSVIINNYLNSKNKSTSITQNVYNICCNIPMKSLNANELICTICSKIITDVDTEEINYEKSKTKYESSKHCKDWLLQIQAKNIFSTKNIEIDKISIEKNLKSKKLLIETKHGFLFIPCYKFRETLKDLKLAIYNNHIPYMRKLITGYIPEQLTPTEEEKIIYIFELCENAYNELNKNIQTKNNKIPNTPYYPYFIYKILEILLPAGPKLDSLLECIHLQADITLNNHDNIWRSICSNVIFLNNKYKPTNKYKQTIY